MRVVVDYRLPEGLTEALQKKFPAIEVSETRDVLVSLEDLVPLMIELKDNPDYAMDFLTNLTAVDYEDGFQLVYNLFSLTHGYTLMIKTKLMGRENPEAPSLCPYWGGANWQEREVFDLMGIDFTGCPGHPTRIFLEDDFEGHPLRKDYRWEGGRE